MARLEPRSRAEFEELAEEYDACMESDRGVDAFCTRTDWVLPFHDAFAPERPIRVGRDGSSWVLLAEQRHASLGRYLEPLENSWGFASPLVGPDAAEILGRSLAAEPMPVLLLGLPAERERLASLARMLTGRFGARPLEPTTRFVADLSDGFDGWLAGRSRAFRKSLRGAERRASEAGVRLRRVVPVCDDLPDLYRRILEVEQRSWKGQAGRGANVDPMRSFYAGMWPRLARHGRLRLVLAERDGELAGYLHGALVGRHFRGLQFSYDETQRDLGLGNVLQLEMLRWLCDDGATSYDLGTHSEYKRRWAPEGLTTSALFLRPL